MRTHAPAPRRDQAEALRRDFAIDLRVLGIATSKTMVLSEMGIDLGQWRQALAAGGKPTDLAAFSAGLAASYIPNIVIIDCTASDAPAQRYLDWMKQVRVHARARARTQRAPGRALGPRAIVWPGARALTCHGCATRRASTSSRPTRSWGRGRWRSTRPSRRWAASRTRTSSTR